MPLRPAKSEGPIYRGQPVPPPSKFERPSTRPRVKHSLGLSPGQHIHGGPLMTCAANVDLYLVVASGGYAPPPGLNIESGASVVRVSAGDLLETTRAEAATSVREGLLSLASYGSPKVWAAVDPINDIALTDFQNVEGTEKFTLLREADLNDPLPVGRCIPAAPYETNAYPSPHRS